MTEDKPKRERGPPLKGSDPMSPAERQLGGHRLIEVARLGTLVHIYADRMAYRFDMAGGGACDRLFGGGVGLAATSD